MTTKSFKLRRWPFTLSADLSGHIGVIVVSTVLILLVTVWMGYDLRYLPTALIRPVVDRDALLNSWTLHQALYNLTHTPIDLGYSTIYYGDPASFAYTIAPYGIALFVLPIYLISNGNLELTYNLYLLVTYTLTAWAMYVLIRYLLKSPILVSILMGLMVAFAQFRFLHAIHIETLSMQLYVFSIYIFHRLLDQPRHKWGIFMAIAFWFTLLSSGYLGMMFIATAGIIFAYHIITQKNSQKSLYYMIIPGFISTILCSPFLSYRFLNPVFREGRSLGDIMPFSATVSGWLSGLSYIYSGVTPWMGEATLFLGFTPILLAIFAVYYQARYANNTTAPADDMRCFTFRDIVILYGLVTVVGYLLTLGPIVRIGGAVTLPSPYLILMQIPGFSEVRVPARFIILAITGTAVLGAFTLTVIRRHLNQFAYYTILAMVGLLLIIELTPHNGSSSPVIMNIFRHPPTSARSWRPVIFDKQTPIYQWLVQQPPGTPVVHYPVVGIAGYEYYAYQPVHNQPMLNGMGTSYHPKWFNPADWHDFPNENAMQIVRSHGIRYIIIHDDLLTPDEKIAFESRWQAFLTIHEDIKLAQHFGQVTVYSIGQSR